MPKSKREYNLAASIIPLVVLKSDAGCSWMRHFRGALRQFITKADFMAGLNEYRFVYAGMPWFQNECKDRKSGKMFSERQIRYCIKIARELGIASYRMSMQIEGVWREGFIFKAHECVTKRNGNKCGFVKVVAPAVAPNVAPHVAPTVAPQPAKNDAECRTPCCTPETLEV